MQDGLDLACSTGFVFVLSSDLFSGHVVETEAVRTIWVGSQVCTPHIHLVNEDASGAAETNPQARRSGDFAVVLYDWVSRDDTVAAWALVVVPA